MPIFNMHLNFNQTIELIILTMGFNLSITRPMACELLKNTQTFSNECTRHEMHNANWVHVFLLRFLSNKKKTITSRFFLCKPLSLHPLIEFHLFLNVVIERRVVRWERMWKDNWKCASIVSNAFRSFRVKNIDLNALWVRFVPFWGQLSNTRVANFIFIWKTKWKRKTICQCFFA